MVHRLAGCEAGAPTETLADGAVASADNNQKAGVSSGNWARTRTKDSAHAYAHARERAERGVWQSPNQAKTTLRIGLGSH